MRLSNDRLVSEINLPLSLQSQLDLLALGTISQVLTMAISKLKQPIKEDGVLWVLFYVPTKTYCVKLDRTAAQVRRMKETPANIENSCELVLQVNHHPVNKNEKGLQETVIYKPDLNKSTLKQLEAELISLSQRELVDQEPESIVIVKDIKEEPNDHK